MINKELLDKIEFGFKEISSDEKGAKYHVEIKVPMDLGFIERMKLITETIVVYDNGESKIKRNANQMHFVRKDDEYVYFEQEVYLETKAMYNYYFSFEANHDFVYFKKNNRDNYKSVSNDEMWKMSVNFKVPDWAQGKMMYQIFVDRFNRGSKEPLKEMPNRYIHKDWHEDIIVGPQPEHHDLWCTDYYGGDLKGVTEKLDYIKSLGVSIIYLCPIVYAQSNHRYDASDYEVVDPYVGCNEDLKELCDKAHSMGIHIVLDSVFNHTGNDSKYFNQFNTFPELGAYQSKDSKYFPFYKYADNHFWHWWGQDSKPECDGKSKAWQDYIYGEGGIIDQWFKLGIDGLRLDVADNLTDEFIEGIRRAVRRNKPDGLIMGEVWKNPMSIYRGRSYLSSGKGMDTIMDYLIMNALIRYYKYGENDFLNHIIKEVMREYPEETINSLMNFTSTHDISRVLNILGSNEMHYNGDWAWDPNSGDNHWYQKDVILSREEDEQAKKIYKSYLLALTCLPGTLSIFYGDEIGMEGLGNLSNRRPMEWDNIDYGILNNVKKMGKLRNDNKFLEKAGLKILNINPKTFSFVRKLDNKEAYVLVSRVGTREKVEIPKEYQDAEIEYRIDDSSKEELSEYGGIVLKKTL